MMQKNMLLKNEDIPSSSDASVITKINKQEISMNNNNIIPDILNHNYTAFNRQNNYIPISTLLFFTNYIHNSNLCSNID